MAVMFSWQNGPAELWRRELAKHLGDFEFRVFPDVGNLDDIEYAMVWLHPIGDLKRYRNLKAVFSIGAGVSHILRDPELPQGVPIVRLVDEVLSHDMALHAVHWVIHFHRNYFAYAQDRHAKRWKRLPYPETGERRVGILGLGEIGQVVAVYLRDLGFAVSGWSRTPKAVDRVPSFHGMEGLPPFLRQTDILVLILPPTAATENILDATRLAAMPAGSFIVNIGRGDAIVDADLIAALDRGHIRAAALDVFRIEPLPESSPFWTHPGVIITPHAAGPTNMRSGARAIADNIRRVMAGKLPHPVVDLVQGY